MDYTILENHKLIGKRKTATSGDKPVWLTLFSIIMPFDALKYKVFENIMENKANAPFFHNIFKSIQALLFFF